MAAAAVVAAAAVAAAGATPDALAVVVAAVAVVSLAEAAATAALPLSMGVITGAKEAGLPRRATWGLLHPSPPPPPQQRRASFKQQQRQEEGVATDTAVPIKEGYRRLLLLRGLSRCWLLVEAAATTSARWVVEAA